MSAMTNAYRQAIMLHHDAHERWPALFDVHAELDAPTFWTIVRDIIEKGTFFRTHEEIIRRMLTAERMNDVDRFAAFTPEDIRYAQRAVRRDKPIKLYRGGSNANLTGFAWTLSKDRALQFAVASGFETGTVVVGYLKPRKIILANALKRDIIAFADNVETGKVYDVRGLKDQQLMDQRLKILVGTSGANHPMGLTPAQYFAEGIAAGTYTTDKIVAHMTASRKMLEPLGFKTRVATIDTILEAVA